ncbi:MAG TPA: hypothetical protein VLA61_00430 [Ideonella sp.]|uniref:hypothetical protein n=1 Tax=Ideonella sp. TaxID=1929293 RepID=UPI002BD37751|nr:hypothetical protein [Ideonella sp.]HSI46715.1 hypothetical protein [Ideonella sp.]
MKKSLTAPAAPSLSTLHTSADASLMVRIGHAWKTADKGFDFQDAQNPGHLDPSANYKFAEGWTANPRVGFTARPGRAMEGTGLAMPPMTSLARSTTRLRDAGPTYSLALAMKQGL